MRVLFGSVLPERNREPFIFVRNLMNRIGLVHGRGRYLNEESVPSVLIDNSLAEHFDLAGTCLLYTSPSPRDKRQSRMPSSA